MASNSKKKNMESQYRVLFTLGQGSFGTVKLASHLKTEALVAIKTVEICKKNIRGIHAEISALETLHHPNIICLYQVLVTSRHVNLITEYIPGGSLYEIIEEDGPMQEEEAKKIFGQVVSAVKYCHSLDLVHHDIKPQNILRDEDGNVKLIDFGLAVTCRSGTLLKRQCGTKSCFAPEIVLRVPFDGKKADVWSLGVVLFFINIGHYPFRGNTMKEMDENITTGTYDIPSHVSGQLENLIHQLLTVAPEMRPSTERIENHPWVVKCEVDIPTETDPDYNIIDRLCGMGFDANEIIESLDKRKYNESMGAYLILKAQADKGQEHAFTTSVETMDRCPTPPPSPADPSISGLPLKKRTSESNFSLLHIQLSEMHVPVALTPSGQDVATSVSMLPVALHCPEKKTSSTSTCALHNGSVAAPSVCNNILEEELPVPPEQHSHIQTSPPKKPGCFKRLTRKIRAGLSRLCCFPCAQKTKTPKTSSKKVAPLREAGGRTQ
ncbi:putative sperm motility kinase W [Arvicanthis niloticus]|uniref:putative sperm motility kinase W n=1 Tax=Arvicanthis niloticus TaxID=61156 RepID=UPI001486D381|nr:putative sperm motility kinase W [Arvicanthis niloticus]XP_034349183.1 putative sperm motility kinase W [Arvicanthis niloticus]XP_034349184.1 putative sperm motility kinase W [Arvicanthis niloticus]XP_034349185.1 putative sperm motility kinase W [Arvicanthis niloticus]XP_034349186.1 putative sperm motility kinase W [Arvicanthis niloticus]XP_034349187.1 putative sperm motility kinase W [Arvicanthis niloticus]XP_034349188.1 putative sperm motility kinase W [Arvicanthis niloticus]XP_03434918